MKMGIYGVWLSTVAGQTWASSMSTTDDAWCTDMFSCWHCQRARHSLGAKESHRWWQRSFYGTVWAFLVFIGHVTLIRESSFGAETWLITQNLKLEKGCMIEKLSSSSSKANESVISKDDHGKLSGDHKHVLVLYFLHHGDTLLIVIVVHLPNCAFFFAKGLSNFAKVLAFCMKMSGITHPTGQLFMAVHLRRYGSVPFLHSLFYLSLNPWEAPDCNRWWLQTLDNTLYPGI